MNSHNKDIDTINSINVKLFKIFLKNKISSDFIDTLEPFYNFNTVYNNYILNKHKVTFRQTADIFWRLLNEMYETKYFKECKDRVNLRYIFNSFDIAKKTISNSLDEDKFLKKRNYKSIDFLIISNKKINKYKTKKIQKNVYLHQFNLYHSKNLYNLVKLLDGKKYQCFLGVENATGIIIPESRRIIREYVVFQRLLNNIMISYQVLNKDGRMILSFEGLRLEVSKQLIYFLSSIFKKVVLSCNFFMKYRNPHLYVICLGFTGFNQDIFNNLIECDKKINKFNKTCGERLIIKNTEICKKYNLKLYKTAHTSTKNIDTHFVVNFIDYKKDKIIEESIQKITLFYLKNYNNYLKYVIKIYNNDDITILKKIKRRQTLLAFKYISKYIDINIEMQKSKFILSKKKRKKIIISIVNQEFTRVGPLLLDLCKNHCNKSDKNNFIIKTDKYNYNFISVVYNTVNDYPINSITVGIIRNPYKRFAEIFIYILRGWKTISSILHIDADRIYRLFVEYNIQNPIDIFNQDPFVRDKILDYDIFKHQSYFLCDTKYNIMVDYLFKFKDYSKLYEFLRKKMGINFKNIRLKQENKQFNKIKIKLTKKEKEYIYNYYKSDFVVFNYPK